MAKMNQQKRHCRRSARLLEKRIKGPPFRFLDLPAEIRNMVYEYLLPECPITTAVSRYGFRLYACILLEAYSVRDERHLKPYYTPVMLYVSQQINAEFGALFYNKTTVRLQFPMDFIMARDVEFDKDRMTFTNTERNPAFARRELEQLKALGDQAIDCHDRVSYEEERSRFQHTAVATQRFSHVVLEYNPETSYWNLTGFDSSDVSMGLLAQKMLEQQQERTVHITVRSDEEDLDEDKDFNVLEQMKDCCELPGLELSLDIERVMDLESDLEIEDYDLDDLPRVRKFYQLGEVLPYVKKRLAIQR